MKCLQKFAAELINHKPHYQNYLQHLNKRFSLLINYDLSLEKQQHTLTMKSNCRIPKDSHIMLISSSEGLCSQELAGANLSETLMIQETLENFHKNNPSFNLDFIMRLRLIVQHLVNKLDPQMPQRQYIDLIEQEKRAIMDLNQIETKIPSLYLKMMIKSNQQNLSLAHHQLEKSVFKHLQEKQFKQVYQNIKNKVRPIGNVPLDGPQKRSITLVPFIDMLKHSFTANCKLQGLYLTHRRQSFFSVKSTQEIQKGCQLSINLGRLNNYELYFKYGITIKNNPYSEFSMPLNYETISEIIADQIDSKMQTLKKHQQQLRSYVRISNNGTINQKDIELLRIVFNNSTDRNNDGRIHQFIKQYAFYFVSQFQKDSNLTDQNLKLLCQQEQSILRKYITRH